MRGTARHDLQPPDLPAGAAAATTAYLALHVDLEARLDEREEPGPHPRRHRVPERRIEDRVDQELPGSQRHLLIDQQHLVLVERALMPGVGGLVAVHPPRVDEPERRLVLSHVPDAGTGQVRAQRQPVACFPSLHAGEPEGVHALPGRVPGWEVQVVEFVQLRADLGAGV